VVQASDSTAAKPKPPPANATAAPPRANSSVELSVPRPAGSGAAAVEASLAATALPERKPRAEKAVRQAAAPPVTWYDLAQESDRLTLTELKLAEGDVVNVTAAALPIRIAGAVARPGSYKLPVGQALDVWQALELAGPTTSKAGPLNVTLLRPASEGRSPQRWFLSVESIEKRPAAAPTVEPGDIIHVESSTGGAIKQAVGNLWSK
jgi:hypothetical protein